MAIDHDVILSFALADEVLGRAIGRYLRASGLRVAIPSELVEGDDVPWLAAVERAVSRSRKLVLVISETTPASWLRAELDFACRQLHLEVIPLIREGFLETDAFPSLNLFMPLRLPADRRLLDQRLEGLVNRIQRDGTPLRPAIDREARPFPGLRPFGLRDGRWFFGRPRELAEGTASLGFSPQRARWLRVEGAPGVGKTSFARAGVVDAVLRGAITGGPANWHVAAFRPGGQPYHALAEAIEAALAGRVGHGEVEAALGGEGLSALLVRVLPPGTGLLLVIDHLDDVAAAWEQGAPGVDAFDTQVAQALRSDHAAMLLVTTSLSGQARRTLDVLPKLGDLVDLARVVALGGLSRSALRSVIEQPLQMIGRSWPPPLVETLIEDGVRMSGAPGALSWALERLLTDKTPTIEWYEALGGLRHGPGRALDTRLAVLDDVDRERALNLMLSLVGAGRGREDVLLGQSISEAEAIAGGGRAGEDLVRALTRGAGTAIPDLLLRLDPDGTHVRLAHPDLLRLWPRMRGIMATHRGVSERRSDVERMARGWLAGARNPALLPEGSHLTHVLGTDLSVEERARLRSILSTGARAYLQAAEAAEDGRHAARAAAEAAERAAQSADRAAERSAAASREAALRSRGRRLGIVLAGATALACFLAVLAINRQARLSDALEDVASLTTARTERDGIIQHLRQDKTGLETERTALTEDLRHTQAQALQANTEAELLLDHAIQSATTADDVLALSTDAAGYYNRRTYFQRLTDGLEARVAANPANDRLRLLLARLQTRLGDVLAVTGPTQRAPEAFERALATLEPMVARPQPAPSWLAALAEAQEHAAEFHLRGRSASRGPEVAITHLEKAIEIWQRLTVLDPQQLAHRLAGAAARVRLSQVYVQLNQTDPAKTVLRQAVAEAAPAASAADKDFDRAYSMARWIGQLADLEGRTGEAASAQAHYGEAGGWLDRALPLAPADQREAVAALQDRFRIRARALTP